MRSSHHVLFSVNPNWTNVKDLSGQRFGRLVVQRLLGKDANGAAVWECRCDCGNFCPVRASCLKNGQQSCGCLRDERARKHGMSASPEYRCWDAMIDRCHRPTCQAYRLYGERGIQVCSEWRESFEQFYQDMGSRPGKGYSLERIDNNSHYCRENCRWATTTEQANNRRTSRRLTFEGQTLTIKEWATKKGIKEVTLRRRLRCGWTVADALTKEAVVGRERLVLAPCRSAEYKAWKGMHERCYSRYRSDYPMYGGRGITVCDHWRKTPGVRCDSAFQRFLEDMGKRPSPAHSLDRIDNDAPYCPENCRWALADEQARNRSTARLFIYEGETICLTDLAARFGMGITTLFRRLQRGWPLDLALKTPPHMRR